MKFNIIATATLAYSSIFAFPINQAYQTNSRHLATQDAYRTTNPYEIRKYINADQIYDKIQEISKIPKDEFVKKVNEGTEKLQRLLEIAFDFGQRLDHLTATQKQQLDSWWAQIALKYQQPFPTDLSQLKHIVFPDLKHFIEIIYQMDAYQTFNNMKNFINN